MRHIEPPSHPAIKLRKFNARSQWVDGKHIKGGNFEAKHFDEPSDRGYKKGRCIVLDIKCSGKTIFSFFKGEVTLFYPEHAAIVTEIVDYLESLPKRFYLIH